MFVLNNDILLIIYSYVGPITIYLDKNFNEYLKFLKNEFYQIPLKLSYKLIEFESKFNNINILKPKIISNKNIKLDLKGNIFLGKYNYKTNKFYNSKQIENYLIPSSIMKLSNSNTYKGKVIYYELSNLLSLDTSERINKYQLLYNKYSF